jgi:hypothetical protein
MDYQARSTWKAGDDQAALRLSATALEYWWHSSPLLFNAKLLHGGGLDRQAVGLLLTGYVTLDDLSCRREAEILFNSIWPDDNWDDYLLRFTDTYVMGLARQVLAAPVETSSIIEENGYHRILVLWDETVSVPDAAGLRELQMNLRRNGEMITWLYCGSDPDAAGQISREWNLDIPATNLAGGRLLRDDLEIDEMPAVLITANRNLYHIQGPNRSIPEVAAKVLESLSFEQKVD